MAQKQLPGGSRPGRQVKWVTDDYGQQAKWVTTNWTTLFIPPYVVWRDTKFTSPFFSSFFMYGTGTEFLSRGFTDRREILHGGSAWSQTGFLLFGGIVPQMAESWASTGDHMAGYAACWSICERVAHSFKHSGPVVCRSLGLSSNWTMQDWTLTDWTFLLILFSTFYNRLFLETELFVFWTSFLSLEVTVVTYENLKWTVYITLHFIDRRKITDGRKIKD